MCKKLIYAELLWQKVQYSLYGLAYWWSYVWQDLYLVQLIEYTH